MILVKEKIKKRDYLFVAFIACLILIIAFIPTGFKRPSDTNSERVRGIVLETDNSQVKQFGIVKTGDQEVTVRILNGRFRGEVVSAVNILIGKMELDKMFSPGDKALVVLDLDIRGQKIINANMIDHYRINVELFLLALFILLLVFFAGWTGLKAMLSFIFTAMVIWKLMLPCILKGWNPILISLAIVSILTAVILFLVGGLTKKGLVAFLGAFMGILLTCLLSLLFGKMFHIHGAVKPFSETLLYSGYCHLNLSKIFLAGIFLASSGAVMDMAMDIAASMQEVAHKKPEISRKEVILSGFSVGRAVVGTMTTTLLLAYTGGYTAMLMVFIAQGTPLINILNITYISSEVLHTVVGSFGLVLVAPCTAVIGGLMFPRKVKA